MEFNWNIEDITRISQDGLIYKIEYSYEAYTSGSSVIKRGEVNITGSSSDSNFIEFNTLSQDTVLSWITGSIPVQEWETELSSSLSLLLDGTYIQGFPDNFHPQFVSEKEHVQLKKLSDMLNPN